MTGLHVTSTNLLTPNFAWQKTWMLHSCFISTRNQHDCQDLEAKGIKASNAAFPHAASTWKLDGTAQIWGSFDASEHMCKHCEVIAYQIIDNCTRRRDIQETIIAQSSNLRIFHNLRSYVKEKKNWNLHTATCTIAVWGYAIPNRTMVYGSGLRIFIWWQSVIELSEYYREWCWRTAKRHVAKREELGA